MLLMIFDLVVPATLFALAAVTVGGMLLYGVSRAGLPPLHHDPSVRIMTACREHTRRTTVPRHCDPDASGRPRPRAPSPA